MVPLLHDVAVLHDQDHVGLLDGGEAVGHDEGGSSLHEGGEGVLDLQLGTGVDGGGRLVQDEHGGQAKEQAGDAEELLLALGQGASVLADDGLVALGEALDEAVGVGCLGGGDHLLVGGVGSAEGDVVPHGSGGQPGLLQHHAVVLPKGVAGDLTDIKAVHRNASLAHVVEAHEQVDERGLTASRGAYDGHPLTAGERKIQIPYQLLIGGIGEGHVGQGHAPLHVGQGHGIGGVGGLGFRLDQLKEAGGAGHGVLQLGDHTRDLVEGLGVLSRVGEEGRQTAYRKGHATCGGEADQRADEGHARVDEVIDEAGGGVDQGGEEHGLTGRSFQSPVDLLKVAEGFILVGKGHHHLVRADHFIHQRGLLGADLGLLLEQMVGSACDEGRYEQRKGGCHHHPHRHGDVEGEHEAQGTQNGENTRKELGKAHEQTLGDLIGIRNDAADRIAHGALVQIGEGEGLDAGEGIVAETAHHTKGDAVVADIHEPLAESRHGDDDPSLCQQGGKGGKVHLSGGDDEVDGVTRQNGQVEGEGRYDHGQEEGQNEQEAVVPQVAEYLLRGGEGVGILFRTLHYASPPLNWDSWISR